MRVILKYNYHADVQDNLIGYVGENNSRKIVLENYAVDGADLYKLILSYPDGVQYEVDISTGEYTVPASLIRAPGYVKMQVVAVRSSDGAYIKKSSIFSGLIKPSVSGDVEPIPPYEDAADALDKVIAAVETAESNAAISEQNAQSANAAKTAAETVRNAAESAATSAAESYEGTKQAAQNAAQSAQAAAESADNAKLSEQAVLSVKSEIDITAETVSATAQTVSQNAETVLQSTAIAENAKNVAVEKSQEIADSAAQIQRNADDISELYNSKAEGIVCESEGTDIVLNDSSDLGFRGLRIFGRSTQDGTPSPETPVPIVSVGDGGEVEVGVYGANLFNVDNAKNGYVTNVGNISSDNVNDEVYTDYQIINTDKINYTIEVNLSDNNSWIAIAFYNAQKEFISRPTALSKTLTGIYRTKGAFDVPDGAVYMRISYRRYGTGKIIVTDGADNSQTLTIPTPNGLPGIPVTSGGNYTDENGQQWVCDEVDFARGVYVQRIGKWHYTNENVSFALQGVTHRFTITANIANARTIDSNSYGYCNIFEYGHAPISSNVNNTIVVHHNGNIYARCDDYQTAEDFKSMLSEKQPVCLYPIADPIETPLTADEIAAYRSLHTNNPTTTITNSGNAHMAVSYTADTKSYIDNKFNEMAAFIIATGGDT